MAFLFRVLLFSYIFIQFSAIAAAADSQSFLSSMAKSQSTDTDATVLSCKDLPAPTSNHTPGLTGCTENILNDPSFEQAYGIWSMYSSTLGSVTYPTQSYGSHSGQTALLTSAFGTAAFFSQEASISNVGLAAGDFKVGTTIDVKGQLYVSNPSAGVFAITLSLLDSNGEKIKSISGSFNIVSPSNTWTAYSVNMEIDGSELSDFTAVRFGGVSYPSGSGGNVVVLFDDAHVEICANGGSQ